MIGRRFWPHRDLGPIVLMSTKAADSAVGIFVFQAGDTILLGRESAGVPTEVHQAVDARVKLPMSGHARSMNVAMSGAIALAEALRQTRDLPNLQQDSQM